jgi:hypothetical protein
MLEGAVASNNKKRSCSNEPNLNMCHHNGIKNLQIEMKSSEPPSTMMDGFVEAPERRRTW